MPFILHTSFVTQQLSFPLKHPHFRLRRTETMNLHLTTMIFHDLTSLRNHLFSMEPVRPILFFYDLFNPKNLNPSSVICSAIRTVSSMIALPRPQVYRPGIAPLSQYLIECPDLFMNDVAKNLKSAPFEAGSIECGTPAPSKPSTETSSLKQTGTRVGIGLFPHLYD